MILVIGAFALFVAHVSEDIEAASIWVEGPSNVTVGQTFELKVTVGNAREGKPLSLADIDISDAYLNGFTVGLVQPKPKSSMHIPIDNSWSFTFEDKIPPGESRLYTFQLKAQTPGIYRGDVDAWEGMRFITGMAQTMVSE